MGRISFCFLLGAVVGHAWDDILAHSRSPVKLMTHVRFGSARDEIISRSLRDADDVTFKLKQR